MHSDHEWHCRALYEKGSGLAFAFSDFFVRSIFSFDLWSCFGANSKLESNFTAKAGI